MSNCHPHPFISIHQGAMYQIFDTNRTCIKSALKDKFHPMEIPKDASLLGQAVVGSSSAPGQGLLVNTWTGDMPDKKGETLEWFRLS